MKLRTFILSSFSMACVGVSVLFYQSQERRDEALQMAAHTGLEGQNCMTQGFETSEGFVGCLQPASYALEGEAPSRIQYFWDEVGYILGF